MSVSRRAGVLALCAAALAVTVPVGLFAQNGTVEGLVLASSGGARVGGVLVVVEGGKRAKSNGDGEYRLKDVPAGEHRVALVAPGCQITFATVQVAPGETRSMSFEIAYDPATAEKIASKRRTSGKVVTAQEIEAMRAHTMLDVLSRVAPGMVGNQPHQPGEDPVARSRNPVGLQGNVSPAVIIDGAVQGESGFAYLQDINPSDVAWLEVQRGATGGWEVGTGGSGGLVRIQTKRGRQMDTPYLEPEQCEIRWAGPASPPGRVLPGR